MRSRSSRSRAAALIAVAFLISCLSVSDASGGGTVPAPRWGFTHTQYSADHGEEPAVAAAQQALRTQGLMQNQHIMGWGADNPEPRPGVYEFASLDARIDAIRRTGGAPVITLCCAPDWMKGGRSGETDWDRLTVAPLPEHFADFADLAATIAARYPDIRHFMVWNELKGFFDESANQWNAELYTDLYNKVYRALKGVNPGNLVGGPYIGMATTPLAATTHASAVRGPWGSLDQRALDVFEFWLENNDGADFVVIDGLATTAGGAPDEFAALDKLAAASAWVRERTPLPLWWAEFHLEPDGFGWTAARTVAVRTAALIEMAKSGVAAALYWNPSPAGPGCAACLWTDTRSADGGVPGPFLTTLQRFERWFPAGTSLREVSAPSQVRVLAQHRVLVVVNTTDRTVELKLDGRDVSLRPYETRWLMRQ